MSYDIINGIKITNDQVIISAASSNVYPKYFTRGNVPTLTKILIEQGKAAVEKVLVREFVNGNFQKGTSVYRKIADSIRVSNPSLDLWSLSEDKLDKVIAQGITAFKAEKIGNYKVMFNGYPVTKFTKNGCRYSYNIDGGKVFRDRASVLKGKFFGTSFSLASV